MRTFKDASGPVSLLVCSRRRHQRLMRGRGGAGSELSFKITPTGGETEERKVS